MAAPESFDRIAVELTKCGGKPCIRRMRITVRRVLELLATYPNRQACSPSTRFLSSKIYNKHSAMPTLFDRRLTSRRSKDIPLNSIPSPLVEPHQIARTLDAVMRPSRLITGTPKYKPVAATIRSGISGTFSRGTFRKASTMPVVSGASSST